MTMTLDIETLRTSAAGDRLPAIIDHVRSLPHAERPDAIESIRHGLRKRELIELMYDWPLRARDSQLPPEEDWDTWRKLTWPSDAITPIIQITRITVQTTPSHSPDRADALVHAVTDLILDRNPIMIW